MTTNGSGSSVFLYVTYIRTTPEKLWDALTQREFTQQYWFGMYQESDWRAGTPWVMRDAEGRLRNTGEVLEADRPRRLQLRWVYVFDPEVAAEGDSIFTMELEPLDDVVKLSIRHEMARPKSRLIGMVGSGWPRILSSLQSLLETGAAHRNTQVMGVVPSGR